MSHCDIVTRVSRCDIVLETGEYGITPLQRVQRTTSLVVLEYVERTRSTVRSSSDVRWMVAMVGHTLGPRLAYSRVAAAWGQRRSVWHRPSSADESSDSTNERSPVSYMSHDTRCAVSTSRTSPLCSLTSSFTHVVLSSALPPVEVSARSAIHWPVRSLCMESILHLPR